MQFTTEYREEVMLAEGTTVRLRSICSEDKTRLNQILAGMSAGSRLFRFFVARREFNETELRYLTEVDNDNHVALLALRGEETIGVGRFVRSTDERRVAEPAFAVVDKYQSRGVGRVLVKRIASAARERGIERFAAEVLPHNRAMLHLFRELDGKVPRGWAPSSDSVAVNVRL